MIVFQALIPRHMFGGLGVLHHAGHQAWPLPNEAAWVLPLNAAVAGRRRPTR